MLTILSVAYPPAQVSRDSCGGAEQILALLDAAIAVQGHRSLVVACEGSSVAGKLVAVPRRAGELDDDAIALCRAGHRDAIARAIDEHPVDIVHMHGFDYDTYLPKSNVPVLATLHCPPQWYSTRALRPDRDNVWINAVSQHQHTRLPRSARLVEPIENGIAVDAFSARYQKRNFVLALGRIAPEKGVHLAIDAAKRADVPLIIAGELNAYPEHRRYFDTEIAPRLDTTRRWIGPAAFAVKRRLLAEARCLLVCSSVEETSSLSAREAIASGTPVVALARGALLETIEHGRTGFLVDRSDELPDAIARVGEIDHEQCRRTARARFDARHMAKAYLQLYQRIVAQARVGSAQDVS